MALEHIKHCEAKLIEYLRSSAKDVLADIATSGQLSDETAEQLKAAIEKFIAGYSPPAAKDVLGGDEPEETAEEGEEG